MPNPAARSHGNAAVQSAKSGSLKRASEKLKSLKCGDAATRKDGSAEVRKCGIAKYRKAVERAVALPTALVILL